MSTSSDSPDGDDVIVVLTTTADDESAGRLARALVEERLAACVTRMAAQSVYRWQKTAGDSAATVATSEVCEESEVLLLIKSARSRRDQLEARILELHSYECPEIVVLDPQAVEPRYRAWLLAACR